MYVFSRFFFVFGVDIAERTEDGAVRRGGERECRNYAGVASRAVPDKQGVEAGGAERTARKPTTRTARSGKGTRSEGLLQIWRIEVDRKMTGCGGFVRERNRKKAKGKEKPKKNKQQCKKRQKNTTPKDQRDYDVQEAITWMQAFMKALVVGNDLSRRSRSLRK